MPTQTDTQNTTHTPGPWRIDAANDPDSVGEIWADNPPAYIADVWTSDADARLIMASSDLLASCIELRDVLNHDCGATEEEHLYEHIGPATIRATAAITKAGVVEP